VIEKLVYDSVMIKSEIVNRDEKEKGERRKLNFGHTFGHAIEKLTGVKHGEAVSAGMALAAQLSVKNKLLSAGESNRLIALIDQYGLPVQLEFDRNAVIETLRMDKKREGSQVYFVFLTEIGNACIEQIDIGQLEADLRTRPSLN
jgi:3-dehydroquinate synthase